MLLLLLLLRVLSCHGVVSHCNVCVQGGDKLTLALGAGGAARAEVVTSQLIEVDSAPTLTTTTVSAPAPAADLLTISSLDTPLSPSKVSLPISVTHFSENGLAGLQRETLFSDTFLQPAAGTAGTAGVETPAAAPATAASTNPFTANFVAAPSVPPSSPPSAAAPDLAPATAQTQDENNPFNSGQKFATIGRTNPFSSPNKSKNPFLDRLDAPTAPTVPSCPAPAPASPSPMSTGSPSNSPDASLDPTSESSDSSTSTLNKIVSRYTRTYAPLSKRCKYFYSIHMILMKVS